MGIISLILILAFFILHLARLAKSILKGEIGDTQTLERVILLSVFVCFLVTMFFDHYFYTLPQAQILLWVILGLIASQLRSKAWQN
jgi:hypothetical protein